MTVFAMSALVRSASAGVAAASTVVPKLLLAAAPLLLVLLVGVLAEGLQETLTIARMTSGAPREWGVNVGRHWVMLQLQLKGAPGMK